MFNEKDWDRIRKKFDNRKRIIKEIVQYIDPKIMDHIKGFFENNILEMEQDISLQVIIDASILNKHIRAYVKYNHSFLLDLLESPFFSGVAPNKLKNEISKHIESIAKYCEKDIAEIEVIASKFLSKISYQNLENDLAYQKAEILIAKRDKDDVEYVALFLKLGKHAIITTDNDILSLDSVKSWKSTKEACEIVSIYQQGSASFIVLATSIPLLGILTFELGTLIISGLLVFLIILIDKIVRILKMGYDFISTLPNEWKLILGILFVTLMIWEDSRELIFNAIKKQINNYIQRIKKINEFIKPLLKITGKWCAEELLTNSMVLTDNITLALNQMIELEKQFTSESNKYKKSKKNGGPSAI